jgi:PQQ-dependent catabolism-associated CXXCW motif protein
MSPVLRAALAVALVCCATFALAQGEADNEAADFGVAPSDQLRLDDHASPTPLALRGAALIGTQDLMKRLEEPPSARPLLFDVLGDSHETLPSAIWLPGAGRGSGFDDAVQAQLATVLEALSGGDKSRAMVFFCSSVRCWLSYNAALRAVRLGYAQVYWYRGGIAAWLAAGGAVAQPRVRWKPPAS